MSRNHTEYYVLKLDDEGYLEPVRMCKTLDRAKRVYAAKGAERVDKWRATPSKCYLRMAYPEKQLNPGTLKRLYRKLRRREEDAKKRVARNQRKERVARWVAIKRSFDRAYGNIARASRKIQRKLWAFWNSLDTGTGGERS